MAIIMVIRSNLMYEMIYIPSREHTVNSIRAEYIENIDLPSARDINGLCTVEPLTAVEILVDSLCYTRREGWKVGIGVKQFQQFFSSLPLDGGPFILLVELGGLGLFNHSFGRTWWN
jgi:hypothetical protein